MSKYNNQLIAQFRSFRQQLKKCFHKYSDSIIDLLDAIAANTGVSSVAELSLSPLFERTYNSLYKAIQESFDTSNTDRKKRRKLLKNLTRTVASVVPKPDKRPFYLIAPDTTPHPRPYARTMPEVGYIYQPNTVAGNKPINIGHNYSIVCAKPRKKWF